MPRGSETRRSRTPLIGRSSRGRARSAAATGLGHQRFSHSSSNRPASCGITRFANSSVLCSVSSRLMLPNWSSSMRWPTLSSVATSRSCSATSSGLPMITKPCATMSSKRGPPPRALLSRDCAAARATCDCTRARSDASLV